MILTLTCIDHHITYHNTTLTHTCCTHTNTDCERQHTAAESTEQTVAAKRFAEYGHVYTP
jgi:hypothetical protein